MVTSDQCNSSSSSSFPSLFEYNTRITSPGSNPSSLTRRWGVTTGSQLSGYRRIQLMANSWSTCRSVHAFNIGESFQSLSSSNVCPIEVVVVLLIDGASVIRDIFFWRLAGGGLCTTWLLLLDICCHNDWTSITCWILLGGWFSLTTGLLILLLLLFLSLGSFIEK